MLLNIERFNIDVFSQSRALFGNVEFAIPIQALGELQKLSNGKGKVAKEAKIALELISRKGVKTVHMAAKDADDALLKLAEESIIATNDRELRDSVIKIGGKVLFLRQRKFLELLG